MHADRHTKEIDLYTAILMLENVDECRRFLIDLLTPQEMKVLQERWRVCQLLDQGELSYRDIHQKTGASLTTTGRVARFLKEEHYKGYRIVLDRMKATET